MFATMCNHLFCCNWCTRILEEHPLLCPLFESMFCCRRVPWCTATRGREVSLRCAGTIAVTRSGQVHRTARSVNYSVLLVCELFQTNSSNKIPFAIDNVSDSRTITPGFPIAIQFPKCLVKIYPPVFLTCMNSEAAVLIVGSLSKFMDYNLGTCVAMWITLLCQEFIVHIHRSFALMNDMSYF